MDASMEHGMDDGGHMDRSTTNLIINYLPQTLSDEEFISMFTSIGPIKSSKVIRDRASGYSYGFGFVDYQSVEDAARAVHTLNGLQLQNKRIKVAFARPGGDTIKGANLYVRNIPSTWKEQELIAMFEGFGQIIQSRVLIEPSTGISRRVGFVLYDKKESADAAIKQLSGKVPPGETDALMIKYADDNSKKVRPPVFPPAMTQGGPMRNQGGGNRFRYNPMMMGPGGQGSQGHVIFVYNIGSDADEKTLWQLFSPFGSVTKVNVIHDTAKNMCKGYGFVTMTNLNEAANAIQCLNGYYYNGRALQVSFKQGN
ncbi:hypothetical protein LOTGIDRAFT_229923 [Lottia gigantea]|uniref:RRM domain-containing protein n=1 Tax=Lottia gigantea TaxID=225164 RepID=V4BG77_LOTGI|nr:hypothetical protein LOTGIDRAFT_229923 [Lottia gigantea]ESP04827.1 hypothetical protein LOTGIDRAFT_229923 [Lottia gigantea]